MRSRDETKAWVRAVLRHLRLKPTELARAIGRAPSTLNRFLNDPGAEHDLSDDTLDRIAAHAGLRPFEYPDAPKRMPGLAEPDAVGFQAAGGSGDNVVDNAVKELLRGRNAADPWILRSRALEHAGYLPGDVLIVDLNERPLARDVVCAQVYDWAKPGAETVFRLYEPPYLVAASTNGGLLKPLVVDDDIVVIKGVVVTSLRPRRSVRLAA